MSKTTILIEGFKGGANSAKAAEAKSVAGFPHEYFKRKSGEMAQRLERYRQTVEVSFPKIVSQTCKERGAREKVEPH